MAVQGTSFTIFYIKAASVSETSTVTSENCGDWCCWRILTSVTDKAHRRILSLWLFVVWCGQQCFCFITFSGDWLWSSFDSAGFPLFDCCIGYPYYWPSRLLLSLQGKMWWHYIWWWTQTASCKRTNSILCWNSSLCIFTDVSLSFEMFSSFLL